MSREQNWRTETYRGLDIHVSALPHGTDKDKWDYTVRVAQPGADAGASAELTAGSGDDDDYSSPEKAVAAGLKKGQMLVDRLLN